MTTFGSIPLSPALAEASPESLREILERDPATLDGGKLQAQVEAIRAFRERLAKGEEKPTAQRKATKKADQPTARTDASADELGF